MAETIRLYTRSGDDGTTGLGGGRRVSKDALRVEAYGTVDELSSQLGVALADGLEGRLVEELTRVQGELFRLGAELAAGGPGEAGGGPVPSIEKRHVRALEEIIDALSAALPPLRSFILPGGTPGAARLHVARTVCRRAERLAVTLAASEDLGEHALPYLNRLSDALFVMARWENAAHGVADVPWDDRD